MKKRMKYLFIAVPVIAILCLLFVFSYAKTGNGIDTIESYESVFQSVEELKFYIGENNFYSTQSPAKELKALKDVKINPAPVSEDSSKNRAVDYKITINGKYIIYLNSDFSQLWLDDTKSIYINYNENSWKTEAEEGLLPSLSYFVENPEILEVLFEEHSQHLNK